MRLLAYIKNDLLGEKIEDQIIKRMITGWQNMTILDVGSGPCRKQKDRRFKKTDFTCFDIYIPYLKACQKLGYKTVYGDAGKIDKHFHHKSFDIVWLIDIVEHMDRQDGFKLLKKVDKIARKQILISTPLGWYPQDYECVDKSWINDIDSGIEVKNKYQQHVSAWYPKDFKKLGYQCEILYNCHPDIRFVSYKLRNKKKPVSASQIWATKLL